MDKIYNGEKRRDQQNINPNLIKSSHHKREECIGFSTLPDQLHKRAVKRGFDFSFMVAGQNGLGKTTFLRCLFPKANWETSKDDKITSTLELQSTYMEVEERGVKLRLRIIDTPGFGSCLDSSKDVKVVESHVKQQLSEYLSAEMAERRQAIQDHRIHCCFYFIDPSSKNLKALDLLAIRSIQDKVNVLPVIAKTDTLTPAELKEVKDMIRKEVEKYGLNIYQLPGVDDDDTDDDYIAKDKELKNAYPFGVVCSDRLLEVAGRKVLGRLYPWGIVEVENNKHSDFKLLRYFLLNSHMHDLIETTKEVHYENYRTGHLNEMQRSKVTEKSDDNIDDLLKEKEMKILEMQKKLEEMKIQMSKQLNNDDNNRHENEASKTGQKDHRKKVTQKTFSSSSTNLDSDKLSFGKPANVKTFQQSNVNVSTFQSENNGSNNGHRGENFKENFVTHTISNGNDQRQFINTPNNSNNNNNGSKYNMLNNENNKKNKNNRLYNGSLNLFNRHK